MTIYFVVAFITLFFSQLAEQSSYSGNTVSSRNTATKTKLYIFIVMLTLILVAGLRYNVGTDYGNYVRAYSRYVSNVWQKIIEFDEPGIYIIAWISSRIYDTPNMMFMIASILTVGLAVKTIEHNTNAYCFALLMYLFMGNWHGSFNAVRQCLAAAIIFAGHRYIIDRKLVRYLLVILVAMCFHKTAIIMIIPYFITSIKSNIKSALLLFVSAVVLLFSYDWVFKLVGFLISDEVTYEISNYMSTSVNIFRILVAIAPAAVMLYFNRKSVGDVENNFYGNMMIINAAAMVAASQSAYLARIGIYTNIFSCIAFSKIFLRKHTYSNVNFTRLIVLLYFIYWIYEIRITSALNNFQWIFGH